MNDNEELKEVETKGEMVELPEEEDNGIELLPDGGAIIREDVEESSPQGFNENLAESLSDAELNHIASDLLDLLEYDQEARKRRDNMYEEGLKRSGVDHDVSVGADFYGASRAVHPMLAEAAVDFCAHAIKELFPSAGPVKTQIIGEVTKEKSAKADRKKTYLNWQLTKQMPEYRSELEQLLTQVSLAGSQYSKVYREGGRNNFEYIPQDQIILPFSATSFYSAKRKAQIVDLTKLALDSRIEKGKYVEVDSRGHRTELDQTSVQDEAQRIEGKEQTGYNEDGLRRFYEVYIWLGIEEDEETEGEVAPYIITVDDYTRRCVAIYRNWKEKDEHRAELQWIVEWPFIPWRGSSTLGLVHLIGTLTVAATGALNGLLDSAHVNNIPTAIALKGSKITGSTTQLEPTTIQVLEGPAGIDDIRKLAMPVPYNPPSPVLLQLLGWLTDAAKNVITTASEKIADASNTGPVGTTYALIEQGAKIFSSIHARLHFAQAQVLDIICRLNGVYLSDKEVVEDLGELIVSKLDFQGPQDICPVSDPDIFCETQRWAQLQEAFKLSQDPRVQYNIYKLHERALELLKFPQIDEILIKPNEPEQTNPVAENVNASMGKPLEVFPEENHLAHLAVHLSFVTDKSLSMISQAAVTPLFAHIQKHLAYLYSHIATGLASGAAGSDITAYMVDPKLANQVDGLLASAAPHVHEMYAQQVQPFTPQIEQLAQMAQQAAQAQAQVPLDPASQVAKEVGMAEVQRKTQADQAGMQLKTSELQSKTQLGQAGLQSKTQLGQAGMQQKAQIDMLKAKMAAEMDKIKASQKNYNALELARLDAIKDLQIAELNAKVSITQAQIDAAKEAEEQAYSQAKDQGKLQ